MQCLSHSLSRWIIIIGLCNSICYTPYVLALDKSTEEKIKAAYTYQFTKFVDWPAGTPAVNGTFLICTLGITPISKELKPLNQRVYKSHPIKVISLKKTQETNDCNILYVSKTQKDKLTDIFASIKDKPVLTVSSINNFAALGGIIGLVTSDNKIRLEINLNSALRADIKLSAKLLEIAKVINVVKPKEEQP